MKQMTLLAIKGFEVHGRATCKAAFLAHMEMLVPWAAFCALIEPHYPKVGNGHPPVGLERMLRMYLIANWFNLADEACEDVLYDIAAFRDFCRIDLGRERVPDATTLLNFCHLLGGHLIGAALFAEVGELLQSNGMKLSGGTIVDATLIAAPPSTKNREQARNPEICQSKKGNQWDIEMKVHIGVDSRSGLMHIASVTPGNVHDSQELLNLLHGDETRLYGDSAYRGQNQRKLLKTIAPNAVDFTYKRAYRSRILTDADKDTNRKGSSVESKVELLFLTLKHLGVSPRRAIAVWLRTPIERLQCSP